MAVVAAVAAVAAVVGEAAVVVAAVVAVAGGGGRWWWPAHVLAWLARSADLFSSASVLSRFCSMMSTFCCLARGRAKGEGEGSAA